MADDLEIGIVHQVDNVPFVSGEIVIKANHLVSFLEEAFTEMGTEEAGSAGD